MQPDGQFTPCRFCGVPIAPDVMTGDPLHRTSTRGIFEWHNKTCHPHPNRVFRECSGSLNPVKRKRHVGFRDPFENAPRPFKRPIH